MLCDISGSADFATSGSSIELPLSGDHVGASCYSNVVDYESLCHAFRLFERFVSSTSAIDYAEAEGAAGPIMKVASLLLFSG